MKWNLLIAGPAQKEFQTLPEKDRERIKAALFEMQTNPLRGDLKRLQGHPAAWRRRIGSYRIIYDLYFKKHTIVVVAIIRRTSSTYE